MNDSEVGVNAKCVPSKKSKVYENALVYDALYDAGQKKEGESPVYTSYRHARLTGTSSFTTVVGELKTI